MGLINLRFRCQLELAQQLQKLETGLMNILKVEMENLHLKILNKITQKS